MPEHHTVIPEPYTAATTRAGLILRPGRGLIVVSGRDRASFLQGLFTNDIVALKPGQGCYTAYLTAQGRMISDLYVYELGDVILLSLGRDVVSTVLAKLDQVIFSEDVQLGDVSDTFASAVLVGPHASRMVAGVVDAGVSAASIAELPDHGNIRGTFGGEPVIVLRVSDTGIPGYELLIDAARMPVLAEAIRQGGAIDIDEATAETLRIEGGVPKFHCDMSEDTIPLEAGIEGRAISMSKGCYVGQEVIVRVLHRGHGRVAERLVGLKCSGTVPPDRGATVVADGREVGRVTSSALSAALGCAIALAYLQRDFVKDGTEVRVGTTEAVVAPLPFVTF